MRVGVQVCYNIWRVPLCVTHVNQLSFHKYLACLQDSSSLVFNFWKLKDFKDLMKKNGLVSKVADVFQDLNFVYTSMHIY